MAIPISQLPSDLVWQGQLDISNPIKKTKYEQLNKAYESQGGGSGVSSSPSGGSNIIDMAKQLLGFQKEAAQPAIKSLEAGIPEVSQTVGAEKTRLEGEKEPLTARYERLLKDVTSRTELATSQEFGRRGIPTTSGLMEQTLAQKISPETERIGLAQEADIRGIDTQISNLTGIETEKIREIRNAMAQLEAGAGQGAIGEALSLSQLGEQQRQFDVGTELQKLQLAEPDTSTITAGGRVLLINNKTGAIIQDLGSSTTGTGSGIDLQSIIDQLKGKTTTTEPKPTNPYQKSSGGFSTNIYNA